MKSIPDLNNDSMLITMLFKNSLPSSNMLENQIKHDMADLTTPKNIKCIRKLLHLWKTEKILLFTEKFRKSREVFASTHIFL